MGPGSRYRLAGTTMNLNLRLWENPWRLMLAVNAAVLIGVFWHKITLPPYVPYIHLLVDYHFGFTKRALIGAIVSLFTAKVPVWLVFALAGAVWLVTAGLFVQLFRRTFGFDEKHLPLFVFMAGSPFFLKNFMHTLGHFDIYGCLFAICLLLIPARSLAYRAACRAVLDRARSDPPHPSPDVCADHRGHRGAAPLSRSRADRQNVAVGIASLAAVGVLFIAAQFYGTDAGAGGGVRRASAQPDGRPVANQPAELWLHLVSAALEGNSGYLGSPAAQPARRAGVCAADLAAHAALAIFSQSDRSAFR